MNNREVKVIVECRGGVAVGVYCNDPAIKVVLVDWDDYHDSGRPGVIYPVDRFSQLPRDTRQLAEAVMKTP